MSDMLSQNEIEALLGGSNESEHPGENGTNFTDEERDAIGEIGNISMGTAATTLSTLSGQKVTITTPRVTITTIEDLAKEYPIPFVAVDVKYKSGLEGLNVLIIKSEDVQVITDLMMGGNGQIQYGELTELHLSAISEAMNQMVGSASTSLSEMFTKKIDIYPPRPVKIDLGTDNFVEQFPDFKSKIVKIAFKMVIGDIIDSEIMQLIPIEFAKDMIDVLIRSHGGLNDDDIEELLANIDDDYNHYDTEEKSSSLEKRASNYQSQYQAEEVTPRRMHGNEKVNVRPVQFQSFDSTPAKGVPENISLIQDVPLKVTVELGRTVKRISEILEFSPGTIIELDKLVGEPLDILVNGQYVAKGEVVVIDENYGIRITDIVNPAKRFSKI